MKIRTLFSSILAMLLLFSCSGNLLLETVGTDSDLTIRLRSLWVVGGLSGNGTGTVVPQIDAFDPMTQTWYPSAATFRSGYERSYAGVAGYRGKIYVIGGFDSAGVVTNTTQIYDIATDTWSDGTVMTAARANINALVYDGYIYILNGSTGNASAAWGGSNTTYRYDISGNNWSTRTAPGANRSNLSAYCFGGTIYSAGGRSAAATLQTLHDGYSPIVLGTDVLTTGVTETALIAAKVGFSADVYTTPTGVSYLIIAGGATVITGTTGNYTFQGTTTFTPTSAVQYLAYPFSAGAAWNTAAQSLPLAVGYGSGLIFGSMYYQTGGTNTGTIASPPSGSNAFYYSDLTAFPSNTWQSGPAMPRGRYGHVVVKILEN